MSAPANTPAAAVDVAVVGGGVIGLTVAWRCAQRGARVAVYEAGSIGAGASHVAAGMLAPVSEAEYGPAGRHLLALGLDSVKRWPAFASELAEAAETESRLRRSGTLIVARDRDAAEALERERAFRESLGLRVARLRPSAAREREPSLAPTIQMALEAPDDHSVDPIWVLEALTDAARAIGVRIHEETRVAIALDAGAERVAGLQTQRGERVSAGVVVVACGAWSAELPGIPEHARVPVRPVKGQILALRDRAGAGLVDRSIRFEGGYLVPRGDGRYALGATVEERGFDAAPTAGGVYELLRDAAEVLPGVLELDLDAVQVGLRPGTPDNVPLIGPGAVDGLLWATGHFRNGILLAPITGELVAAAVTGARVPSEIDPRRFADRGAASGVPA